MAIRTASALFGILALAGTTLAGTVQVAAQNTMLLEMRGGVAMHDFGKAGTNLFDPTRVRDINAELLFTVPNLNAWAFVGELRPHIGATVSLAGQESFAYAGMSWTVRAPVLPVFAEAGLGAALHSSSFQAIKTRFGCDVLLEAQGSLGVEVLPFTAIMASLQHVSDFGLCGTASDPVTTAGLRVGVRF